MSADSLIHRRGFTLIEVLVALAIVALGLIGVFGQISQTASAATRLRDKTLASWVALNKLTELRLQGAFPRVGTSSGDDEMANTKWHWEMTVSETDGKILRRADIAVSFADKPDRAVASVSGFLVQKSAQQPPGTGTVWGGGAAGSQNAAAPKAPAPGSTPPPAPPPPPTVPDQPE
jgi:general secretion pathway protein I